MTQQAAVAAGDQHTVDAAVRVLRAGGNAIDAAVAAGFASAVTEPCLTSLGGGGFLLHRDATGGSRLLDFFVDAPGAGLPGSILAAPHFEPITLKFAGTTQTFHCGYGSVAVPGVLSGFLHAHATLGRIPLQDVVEPAIELAREGFLLSAAQASILTLLTGIITSTPEADTVFGSYTNASSTGDLVTNHLYADFLDELANTGPSEVAPSWQKKLVTAMQQHEGLVTAEDLASYRVVEREALAFELHDATVLTNPSPSFGGIIVGEALSDAYNGRPTDQRLDPVPMLQALARATVVGKSSTNDAATSIRGTTQISIIDGDGGIVSMTTSNGSCSGVMIPGTGIQLNNMMGEADLHPHGFHRTEPGTRIASMMAPSIVTWPDGSAAAVGSGGSERIRSAIVQVASGLLAGDSAAQAVDAPRFHLDEAGVVQAEPGILPERLADVASTWPMNEWPARDLYFGGANVVHRAADGRLQGAGDPRRGGAAAVIDL